MQKTLDILEKNVQWFALGLGGIFLLWVVWSYVVTPPATVTMDRKTFGPGEVAEYTANGPVRDIQNQIDSEKQVAPIQVADLVAPWRTQMESSTSPPLAIWWPGSLTRGGTTTGTIIKEPGPNQNPAGEIAAVPQLPKAQPTQSQSGLSVVQLPGQKNNGGNVQAAADEPKDLPWVSETFVIPAAALKAAFESPLNGEQPPPGVPYNTTMLQVVLQRQRATGVDANNQPTFPQNDQGVEDVPPPATVSDQIKDHPLPGANADVGTKYGYVDWAQKSFELLAQPPFYDVKAGDPYTSPTALPAAASPAAAPGAVPPPATPAPAPATPPATAPNNNPRDLFGNPRSQANSPTGFAYTDEPADRRRDRGNRGNPPPGFAPFGAGRGATNGPPNGLIDPLKSSSG